MVLETPPQVARRGRRHVVPLGHRLRPARSRSRRGRQVPDRAARLRRPAAGRRLLRRPLPDQPRHVVRPRRSWRTNDPKPVVETIKKFTKIYPYEPGGVRHAASPSSWQARPSSAGSPPPPPTVFHEGSGKVMNTIPPNDFSYFEMLNEVVQQEPAGVARSGADGAAGRHRHRQGQAVRARRADEEDPDRSAAVANATSRTLFMNPRDPSWYYYPDSAWFEPAVRQRLQVRDAAPDDHARRASSPSRPPATARWTRARRSSTASPASRRR